MFVIKRISVCFNLILLNKLNHLEETLTTPHLIVISFGQFKHTEMYRLLKNH